jgi:hypothetical protein
VRGKLLPVRVRMGIVPWRKGGFFLRVVGGMGVQVIQGMMLVPFRVAFLVLAWVQCEVVWWVALRCFGFVSRCHNFVILLLTDKPAEGTRPFTALCFTTGLDPLGCLNTLSRSGNRQLQKKWGDQQVYY